MIKFIVRMTASSWILYSLLNLMGMSHGMSLSIAVPAWLLLLTLYDDADLARNEKKRVTNMKGVSHARR